MKHLQPAPYNTIRSSGRQSMQLKGELPKELDASKDSLSLDSLMTFRVRAVIGDLGKAARDQSKPVEDRMDAVAQLGDKIAELRDKKGSLGYDLTEVRKNANAQLFTVITQDSDPSVRTAAIKALNLEVSGADVLTYSLLNGVPASQTKDEIVALTQRLINWFPMTDYVKSSFTSFLSKEHTTGAAFLEDMKNPMECLRLNSAVFISGQQIVRAHGFSLSDVPEVTTLLFDPLSPLTNKTRIGIIVPVESYHKTFACMLGHVGETISNLVEVIRTGTKKLACDDNNFPREVNEEALYALAFYRDEVDNKTDKGLRIHVDNGYSDYPEADRIVRLDELKQKITFEGQAITA